MKRTVAGVQRQPAVEARGAQPAGGDPGRLETRPGEQLAQVVADHRELALEQRRRPPCPASAPVKSTLVWPGSVARACSTVTSPAPSGRASRAAGASCRRARRAPTERSIRPFEAGERRERRETVAVRRPRVGDDQMRHVELEIELRPRRRERRAAGCPRPRCRRAPGAAASKLAWSSTRLEVAGRAGTAPRASPAAPAAGRSARSRAAARPGARSRSATDRRAAAAPPDPTRPARESSAGRTRAGSAAVTTSLQRAPGCRARSGRAAR